MFADLTLSFDNVIGVVAAAKGYFELMIFGLILSVILTGALATYLASYIQKHLWIAYIGLAFILIVALQLVIGGLADLEILKINERFLKYFNKSIFRWKFTFGNFTFKFLNTIIYYFSYICKFFNKSYFGIIKS